MYKLYAFNRFIMLLVSTICISIFLLSCDGQNQYPLSTSGNISMNPVTDVSVQNIPGGAIISYKLPGETELLYVKAVYRTKDNEGKIKRVRKQIYYKNEIKVTGFVETSTHIVKLYTVSRGEKSVKSEPVKVKIHPLQPPLRTVFKSIDMSATFGGLHFQFQNPDTARVAITILSKDSLTGEFTPLFRKYTQAKGGSFNIRGLKSIPQKFGYYVRNKFNQHSDTVYKTLKPLFEEKINSKYFQKPNPIFPSGFYISEGPGTWTFSDMWDGTVHNFDPYSMWISGSTSFPVWFAIDLGQLVRLSRITYHGRPDYNFTSRYPKEIEIWGSADPKIDPEHPFNSSWHLLGKYNTVNNLPEGLKHPTTEIINAPYSENGINLAIKNAGNKPSIRYVRIKINTTWGGVDRFIVGDLSFFGKVIKPHDVLVNN